MSQFVRAKNLTVMVYVVSFTHSYSAILLGKQGGGDSLKWQQQLIVVVQLPKMHILGNDDFHDEQVVFNIVHTGIWMLHANSLSYLYTCIFNLIEQYPTLVIFKMCLCYTHEYSTAKCPLFCCFAVLYPMIFIIYKIVKVLKKLEKDVAQFDASTINLFT